jgi:hypothetical protein
VCLMPKTRPQTRSECEAPCIRPRGHGSPFVDPRRGTTNAPGGMLFEGRRVLTPQMFVEQSGSPAGRTLMKLRLSWSIFKPSAPTGASRCWTAPLDGDVASCLGSGAIVSPRPVPPALRKPEGAEEEADGSHCCYRSPPGKPGILEPVARQNDKKAHQAHRPSMPRRRPRAHKVGGQQPPGSWSGDNEGDKVHSVGGGAPGTSRRTPHEDRQGEGDNLDGSDNGAGGHGATPGIADTPHRRHGSPEWRRGVKGRGLQSSRSVQQEQR